MKNLKYILFILLFISLIGSTIFLIVHNEKNNKNYFTSEILILKDNVEYEVKLNNATHETSFRIGDVSEVYFSYPREGKYRYSLPVFETIIGDNVLKDLKPVVDYTYNVEMTEGYKYIKYLLDSKYELKMYVATSQYIEFFLLKDTVYKRVVLFSDSLMVCDMVENSELPQIYEYLETYNFNNKLVEKFEIIKDK